MTIEEKIKTLIEMYHYIKGDTHFCGYIEEDATNALETAIDTICKYQKIEQLIADYEEYKCERIDVKDIREIIDGNDD